MINFSKDSESTSDLKIEPIHREEIEEGNENHYIHQLTMQTMVNRDVLRKINERKQRTATTEPAKKMSLKQLQEMVRELWEVTQTKEFSLDMNSVYPYELQKSFDQFVVQSRAYLEKHPEFMNLPLSPHSHLKPIGDIEKKEENHGIEKKGEEDTKEIHMLPVFMEKQHPLWNYNHFNRRKAIHAYPPDSEYHISSSRSHSSLEKGGIWKKQHSGEFHDTLFGELEEDF
jgi:hypothetical protein